MKIAFLKEAGIYVAKEFTEDGLVDWFKDHSTQIPTTELSDEHGRTMNEDVLLYGCAHIKADDEGEGFPWVLSDFTLDRDMERMDPSGWELKEYRKNPIVQWGHERWEPAIGYMKNVKKASDEKGELTGVVYFDESGDDPLATKIHSKVKAGILTKGSVGFRVKVIEILEDQRDGTRLIHRKMELMEFSIVNIPANPSAQVRRSVEGGTDPKHYTQELFQNDEGHETSAGETSDLEGLFNISPEEGKSNLQELFNGEN